MSRKKSQDSGPKSLLDGVARDLNRTLLHGARVKTNQNLFKPATLVTGQQIRVTVPAAAPMNFKFEIAAAGESQQVSVKNSDAVSSEKIMESALGSNADNYLSLDVDLHIPTWAFAQREFSLPDQPAPEEIARLVNDTILLVPATVLHEVKRVGRACDVSLWRKGAEAESGDEIPTTWQPAILLRFPLEIPKTDSTKSTAETRNSKRTAGTERVLQLKGARQGDRYYLDQLGLLPNNIVSDAPVVASVTLLIEGETEPVDDYTLVRTNLTEQARPEKSVTLAAGPTFPYLATKAEPEDTLRLLQMASITNSGGYYLRVKTSEVPKVLIVCVRLQPSVAHHPFSVPLPRAANAIAYPNGGLVPNVARFEEMESINVSPFVPPGHAAFGWTRSEPETKSGDEEKFGFGTVSLVDYDAVNGSPTPPETADKCIAISPLKELPGEHLPKATPNPLASASGLIAGAPSSTSAAIRLHAPHYRKALLALQGARRAAASGLRYFRGTVCCYDPEKESPYAPLADPTRHTITITPGFRDVFGNRFKVRSAGSVFTARLSYTDALVAPAEWPGFRFSLYPTTVSSKPAIALEIVYTPLPGNLPKTAGTVSVTQGNAVVKGKATAFTEKDTGKSFQVAQDTNVYAIAKVDVAAQELTLAAPFAGPTNPKASYTVVSTVDRMSRYLRLLEILQQLEGAKGDVKMSLVCVPLLHAEPNLTATVTSWFRKAILPLEDPKSTRDDLPPTPPAPLSPFRCDASVLAAPVRFAPLIRISRTEDFKPDLPADATLATVIWDQIREVASPPVLAQDASPSLLLGGAGRVADEFQNVAVAFHDKIAPLYCSQVGYLRDQFNQHQLWFLPDEFFPKAATNDSWSYATARPLNQKLGTDEFEVPDFTSKPSPAPPKNWEGYELVPCRFVEQDYDELGRAAFRLIEREAFRPEVVTDPSRADSARNCLKSKDLIARTLATWDKDTPGFIIPLFEKGGAFEKKGILRAGRDSFLQDLNGFYRVDTVVQLPLDQPAKPPFVMLQGKVTNPFAPPAKPAKNDLQLRLPTFSDVLLKGGEKLVTVLYDVPPGTLDPNSEKEVPSINQNLVVNITHVQLPADTLKLTVEATAFNQGPWLQLAREMPLTWAKTGKRIPVAIRKFPSKPSIARSVVNPPKPLAGNLVHAGNVLDLIKWGWTIEMSAEGKSTDTIHATIRYNDLETDQAIKIAAADGEWPDTILRCLIVLNLLDEHWAKIKAQPGGDPLSLLEKLLVRLAALLAQKKSFAAAFSAEPVDKCDITFPQGVITLSTGTREIMNEITLPNATQLTLVADAQGKDNNACLLGSLGNMPPPVYNFRPSLKLIRNEAIDVAVPGHKPLMEPLDKRLIFECAIVEAPRPVRAANLWVPPLPPLQYQRKRGQSLQDALIDFFNGLFNGATIASLAVEVSVALYSRREALTIVTPFSLVPVDLMPTNVGNLATRVYDKAVDLLGQTAGIINRPPEVDEPALRLHLKISDGDSVTVGRTRVEIAAIDFPLDPPKRAHSSNRSPRRFSRKPA